ncbi:NRDE family protein [Alteromonas sp. CYL-A6]|uniref:NRDE family protein n=1 Tax=Alteromonas nitratireducens TaxID=3390813 RepID=UPI0034B94D8E
MCILFIAHQQRDDFPLIIAANRDEFHARPASASHFWSTSPDLLAGQDLEAGGTWMGITRGGRIAALTNIRDPARQQADAQTRGELVTGYLCHPESTDDAFTARLRASRNRYNGYNLLFGNQDRLQVYNNQLDTLLPVTPGIHGLSNAALNSPWPKVTRGMRLLTRYCEQADKIDADALFSLLQDDTPADDSALPDTGVPYEWEKRLSSIFIRSEAYGTRASTILLADRSGVLHWHERQFTPDGARLSTVHHVLPPT